MGEPKARMRDWTWVSFRATSSGKDGWNGIRVDIGGRTDRAQRGRKELENIETYFHPVIPSPHQRPNQPTLLLT